MKYSFYCLPLKKSVKGKVTGIVKKKSYGIKGEYKYKGKTYNCHKVCSKAEAERVSKESGIDITYPGMEEAKASENVADVVDAPVAEEQADGVEEVAMIGDETFQPDGNGRVIGSNSASMTTATPGTDAVVNINATPFNGEDDEDGIGPMSMASEVDTSPDRLPGESTKEMFKRRDTPEYKAARKERQKKKREDVQKTAPYLKVKDYEKHTDGKGYVLDVGLPSKVLLHGKELENSGMKIDEIDTIQVHSQEGGRFPMIVDNRFKGWQGFDAEKKNCGCGQDPCITYGADTVEIEVQDEKEIPENFETFTVSKDLYRRLTAHDDWSDMVSEGQVRVYREDDGVHVSAGGPFADDLLDMIIEAQGFPTVGEDTYLDDRFMRDFNTEGGKLKRNAFISAGIGTLGLIAAVMLLNRFAKSQDEDSTED
tara:strand:- start:9550 stop:10824 length:1275 start_codon:yes stop_codon:yes gene_type:complete